MRVNFALIAFLAIAHIGHAQEIETLISSEGSESKSVKGFGGPLIQTANINDDWGLVIGGMGGAIINRKFAIGGMGKAFVNNISFVGDDFNGNSDAPLNLDYAGGGLFLEYIHNIESPIHFSVPFNLLAGGITVNDGMSEEEVESSGVFILEGGVNVEFNVSQTFITGINLSYRQAFGSSLVNLTDQDISGLNIGLMFKFGSF